MMEQYNMDIIISKVFTKQEWNNLGAKEQQRFIKRFEENQKRLDKIDGYSKKVFGGAN